MKTTNTKRNKMELTMKNLSSLEDGSKQRRKRKMRLHSFIMKPLKFMFLLIMPTLLFNSNANGEIYQDTKISPETNLARYGYCWVLVKNCSFYSGRSVYWYSNIIDLNDHSKSEIKRKFANHMLEIHEDIGCKIPKGNFGFKEFDTFKEIVLERDDMIQYCEDNNIDHYNIDYETFSDY